MRSVGEKLLLEFHVERVLRTFRANIDIEIQRFAIRDIDLGNIISRLVIALFNHLAQADILDLSGQVGGFSSNVRPAVSGSPAVCLRVTEILSRARFLLRTIPKPVATAGGISSVASAL